MSDDRFKDAGEFEPNRAWARVVRDNSRRRSAMRVTFGDRSYTAGFLSLLVALVLLAAGGLAWWILG